MSQSQGFRLEAQPDQKSIHVLYNGKLMTAYCYFDSIRKPILFPINTIDGITVTRGFPIEPRPGERTDHPHHAGSWLNYESVNGLDFWNNSTAIPVERRSHYGTIFHDTILKTIATLNKATLVTGANWRSPNNKLLLRETTEYVFSMDGDKFIIDRVTTLMAADTVVVFKDVKDGFFAIRVARELEMPSTQEDVFIDAQGNPTTVAKRSNEGVTGMYESSKGVKGDSVWSTQADWVILRGSMQGRDVSISIFDHKKNPGYPAYWHARGYGLFAINPLGRKIFSNGKDSMDLRLSPGKSVTFRYRMMIRSDEHPDTRELNDQFNRFSKQY